MNTLTRSNQWLQHLNAFRLIDDTFFNQVFQNNAVALELLLRIILDQPDLHIVQAQTQCFLKNLFGRSVRLDAYAVDTHGVQYNIEVQRASKDGKPIRARYNSSLLDANISVAGEKFAQLPDTYIVFITEHDILGKGQSVYHITRTTECGDSFADGSHIIYVNGALRDGSPVGQLMHDFFCTKPSDMIYPQLAELVRYYKENKDGVQLMCKVLESVCAENAIAIYRKKMHLTDEQIASELMSDFSITREEAEFYLKTYPTVISAE